MRNESKKVGKVKGPQKTLLTWHHWPIRISTLLVDFSHIPNTTLLSYTLPTMAGIDRDRHTTTVTDRYTTTLGDRDRPHGYQLQVHPHNNRFEGGFKSLLPENGPTAGQVIAVLAGLPVGGTLLALSGFTLMLTLIGLAVATPLFVIFSPVIVPAMVVIGMAVGAILTSGALGITGLSSLSWVASYVRQVTGGCPMDEAKRKVVDVTDYVGQKTKDLGQGIQNTAHSGIAVGGGDRVERRSS
jgi:hypothetical protein